MQPPECTHSASLPKNPPSLRQRPQGTAGGRGLPAFHAEGTRESTHAQTGTMRRTPENGLAALHVASCYNRSLEVRDRGKGGGEQSAFGCGLQLGVRALVWDLVSRAQGGLLRLDIQETGPRVSRPGAWNSGCSQQRGAEATGWASAGLGGRVPPCFEYLSV